MQEDIRCFLQTSEKLPFVIEMTGISYCDENYHIIREQSKISVMEYIIRGKGTLYTSDGPRTLETGDIYFWREGARQEYSSDCINPWEKIFFNIRGDVVLKLLEAYGMEEEWYIFSNCPLEYLFREFYSIACSNKENDIEIFSKCALKFHEILAAISLGYRKKDTIPNDATLLKQRLDQSLIEPITIEKLAKTIYRSKDYTIKLFKRIYGQTPYEYLIARRMETAKLLLRGSSLSIKEVSKQVGYSDPQYFSNAFKKYSNCSPLDFRKQGRIASRE